jgi:hypothetical protein
MGPSTSVCDLGGMRVVVACTLLFAGNASALTASAIDKPSRKPEQGCVWKKFADDKLRLHAWVQHCNYEGRTLDFVTVGQSLSMRYSDGSGAPDPVVDVLDLLAKETPEQGLRRWFDAHTDKALAARCVLAQFHDDEIRTPVGVKRYSFVPNRAYQKSLDAKAVDGDIPDPPCGNWGESADGIQYFETQPGTGVPKVLFVRYGQDTPLFDEATLHLQ